MSSTYDENLLAKAPAATREARQEGYNIDLLESERPSPPIPSRTPGAGVPPAGAGASFPPPGREVTPRLEEGQAEQASVGATKEYASLGDRGEYDSKADEKVPWHRTTKGIIILTVLALVVIGAAVGGGVGGALSGKSNNKNNNNGKSSVGITPAPTGPGAPIGVTSISSNSSTPSTALQVTIPSSTGGQSAVVSGRSSRRRGPAAPAPALPIYH